MTFICSNFILFILSEDVIKHVKNSNELAGETVKIEVLKERQKTAKRLRAYYLKCLSDMLDKDFDRCVKDMGSDFVMI